MKATVFVEVNSADQAKDAIATISEFENSIQKKYPNAEINVEVTIN